MSKKLPDCPVEVTLQLIGNRWTPLIIRTLMNGTKRFGEIHKEVYGISQKVLTQNLRSMEENRLVVRKVYPVVPPKVEYTLTKIGYSLETVINSMFQWGENYKNQLE